MLFYFYKKKIMNLVRSITEIRCFQENWYLTRIGEKNHRLVFDFRFFLCRQHLIRPYCTQSGINEHLLNMKNLQFNLFMILMDGKAAKRWNKSARNWKGNWYFSTEIAFFMFFNLLTVEGFSGIFLFRFGLVATLRVIKVGRISCD